MYVEHGVALSRHVLPWLAFVSRLVRFVALKRHRSVSDWHTWGDSTRSNCSKKDVFCSECLSLPGGLWISLFLRDPGSSTLSVLEHSLLIKAPIRRPTPRNSTASLPSINHHQSIAAPERRFQFIRACRALSSTPRQLHLPPPACQRVAAAHRPALYDSMVDVVE